jgi:hypothetical protein
MGGDLLLPEEMAVRKLPAKFIAEILSLIS